MKLSEIKNQLPALDAVEFQLPDGTFVPSHFHITEVGVINKHFIDCGGTERKEQSANFQLWNANDTDHRLQPKKLLDIILLSEKVLNMPDLEIEVEYQSGTIGKYGLEFNGKNFLLTSKHTDCLAKDNCGVPQEKQKLQLVDLSDSSSSCCTPGTKCC
ncbi:MAG: DUF6428 family protein [Bacteroidota bacterium]|nr:DUF6428 family protein [Bacteroidota bacterium]